jgi:carbonic anhydrase
MLHGQCGAQQQRLRHQLQQKHRHRRLEQQRQQEQQHEQHKQQQEFGVPRRWPTGALSCNVQPAVAHINVHQQEVGTVLWQKERIWVPGGGVEPQPSV